MRLCLALIIISKLAYAGLGQTNRCEFAFKSSFIKHNLIWPLETSEKLVKVLLSPDEIQKRQNRLFDLQYAIQGMHGGKRYVYKLKPEFLTYEHWNKTETNFQASQDDIHYGDIFPDFRVFPIKIFGPRYAWFLGYRWISEREIIVPDIIEMHNAVLKIAKKSNQKAVPYIAVDRVPKLSQVNELLANGQVLALDKNEMWFHDLAHLFLPLFVDAQLEWQTIQNAKLVRAFLTSQKVIDNYDKLKFAILYLNFSSIAFHDFSFNVINSYTYNQFMFSPDSLHIESLVKYNILLSIYNYETLKSDFFNIILSDTKKYFRTIKAISKNASKLTNKELFNQLTLLRNIYEEYQKNPSRTEDDQNYYTLESPKAFRIRNNPEFKTDWLNPKIQNAKIQKARNQYLSEIAKRVERQMELSKQSIEALLLEYENSQE